jgi:hypothetical protein
MAKGPEIPKTDSAEIEILIERLKQNKLEQRDVELIERLLRTVLALVNLLQRKNMSIKRLRDLIFGRRTEKRKTGSVGQPEDKPEEGAGCDPGAEREVSEKSQRQRQAGLKGTGGGRRLNIAERRRSSVGTNNTKPEPNVLRRHVLVGSMIRGGRISSSNFADSRFWKGWSSSGKCCVVQPVRSGMSPHCPRE